MLNHFVFEDELRSTCDFDPLLLQEGSGVYEVIRVIEGKPLFADEHVNRLFRSVRLAGMHCEPRENQIRSRLKVLIESNGLREGNIRFQFLDHPLHGRLFLAWVIPAVYPLAKDYQDGVRLATLKAERDIPNAKRDKMPVREKADRAIREKNVFEVLLVNRSGFVTEGSRSNVFFIAGKEIVTPPLSAVLPGVTRSKIIGLVREAGITTREAPVAFSTLADFDAVFLSGTSINLLPVNKIDKLVFPTGNRVVIKAMQAYDDLIRTHIENFSW